MFQELEQRQNAELLLTKQKQSAIIYHEPNRIYIRGAFAEMMLCFISQLLR